MMPVFALDGDINNLVGREFEFISDKRWCPKCRRIIKDGTVAYCPTDGEQIECKQGERYLVICIAQDAQTMQHKIVYGNPAGNYVTGMSDFDTNFQEVSS